MGRSRKERLILITDNGNAMRAATLERHLEKVGLIVTFSMPQSNDDNYTE